MVVRRRRRALASFLIRRARASTTLQCCWVLPLGSVRQRGREDEEENGVLLRRRDSARELLRERKVARERVDAGASAFGAEGAFVLWVCDVSLSVLGWRWLRGWDVLLSNKFNEI